MEKGCSLKDSTKNNSCEIEVLNYSDGETIDYPFVLLECQFKNNSKFDGEFGEKEVSFPRDDNQLLENHGKVVQVLVETRDECVSWPVIRGAFKVLLKLVPGDNNLRIKASMSEKRQIQKDFHLVYKPSTLPRFVRVVYVKCVDSDGSFEAPPEVANNIEVAQKKLAFNSRLLQTFTAQDLYKHGFGHRTFRLEENSEGEPLIHVFTTSLTTEEALKMNGGELYSQFSKELTDSNLYDPLCKFWTFMSCTHYDPPPPEEFDEKDVHLYVKAHTALGGGHLALFGTGGLHTWADNVDDLVSCFTNSKKVDRRCLFDDSCRRGFYWANYATGLGASMHELGHCFDLAHTPKGIMGRGFDDFNCVFTLWRNPPQHQVDKENIPGLTKHATGKESSTPPSTDSSVNYDQPQESSKDDQKCLAVSSETLSSDSECCNLALPGDNSHGATWYRTSAVLLRYHKWFSSNKESGEELSKLPLIHWGRQFYGPMGTMSGNCDSNKVYFNDKTWLSKNNARLGGYIIYADVYVNCIQTIGLAVVEQDDVETVTEVLSEPCGREGVGRRYIFRLEHPDEHLIAVDLRSGAWIDALRFHTNYKSSLWMGGRGGSLCHFEPSPEQSMVGVFGCAGNYVNSLGFFLESPQSSSSPNDPQGDEELIIEAPNGLRLIELQNKTHGEVFKHWEFLDACPPTRFSLDRDDIIKQESTILIEDDLGNIQRSGPFYDFDQISADDGDNALVIDDDEGEPSLEKDDSTEQESDSVENKVLSEN
ncbi:uncharacterized protein LOC116288818 [Actinia tenebrosa]|uniref:Uncharacterized protein LOC116288818 n=1 Tax=Actinia tenebrosa TaxID=6105 RepID=A0A6P8HG04_ACTTE|nr:uncharacterized protein LOC116288818 [Actinia tenebrosa]